MTSNLLYVECFWCGNRWYQEQEEPKICEVCQHYPWEGTQEEHIKFADLEAWAKFIEEEKKKVDKN